MFDTIILLTGPVEQTTLGDLLRAHNPQLTLQPVVTAEDGYRVVRLLEMARESSAAGRTSTVEFQ